MATRPTKDGRQYRPTAERQLEIIEAAIAIIAESGLRDLKTKELARRVGISEATLFRHFGSMEEILAAAVEHEAGLVQARVEAFEGSGTPWERAGQLVRAMLDFFEETGGGPLVVITGQVIRISPEVRALATSTIGLVRQRFAALAADVAATPGGAGVSAERLADLLVAVVQSNGLRWLISDRRWPMRESAEEMLAIIGRGLVPAGGRR